MTRRQNNTLSHNSRSDALTIVMVIGALILVGMVMMFTFGESLFGSSRSVIDSYNRDVLNTCVTPSDSTLVRTYTLGVGDGSGRQAQTMSYVYASPLEAEELAAFYGVNAPGIWTLVGPGQACKFGNVPSVLVQELSSPDPASEFWGGSDAVVTDLSEAPTDTRSFVRLRLGQRYVEGLIEF